MMKNNINRISNLMFFVFIVMLALQVNYKTAYSSDTHDVFIQKLNLQGLKASQKYLLDEISTGNINAVHYYAKLLIEGRVIKKNIRLAMKILEKGVQLKDPVSSYLLGKFYSDANYIKPNYTQARKYYELAKNFGHPKAASMLKTIPNIQKNTSPEITDSVAPSQKGNKPVIKDVPNIKTKKLPVGYAEQQVKWDNDYVDFSKIDTVGSGFAITSDGLIATNEHVVGKCKKVFVVYQGKIKIAQILNTHEKFDFAVIKINEVTPSFFFFKKNKHELGEELISGGFPSPNNLGFGIKITTGVVSSEDYHEGAVFQHSTPTQPGNSGGPLLNNSGLLVGISTAVYAEKIGKTNPQNINFAVSNRTAMSLLKKWNLPFSYIKDNIEFKKVILAKFLKKTAVQVLCY